MPEELWTQVRDIGGIDKDNSQEKEVPYSQQKQDQELTVAQILNSLLPNSDLN